MAEQPLDKLSPIPDPRSDGFGAAVKQALNVLLGRAGKAGDRAVTMGEISALARAEAERVAPVTPFTASGLPDPPTGLAVSRAGLHAELTWVAPDDERVASIEIWRAENSQNRSAALLAGWAAADATRYVDYGILPGSFYTYWIRSKGWNGLYSEWEPPDHMGGGTVDAIGVNSVNEAVELIAGGDYKNNFRVIADAFQVVQPAGDVPDWVPGSYGKNALVKVPGGPGGYTYYRGIAEGNTTQPPSSSWVWVDPVALGVAKRVFTVGKVNNAPAVGIAGDMVVDGTIMGRALAAEVVLANVLVTSNYTEGATSGWRLDAAAGTAVFNNMTLRISSSSDVVDAGGNKLTTIGGIKSTAEGAATTASNAATTASNAATAVDAGLDANGYVKKILKGASLGTETVTAAGLYMTSGYIGYYSGSAWNVYIDSAGKFLFKGDATHYLAWDGTNLILQGKMKNHAGTSYIDLLATGSNRVVSITDTQGADVFYIKADGSGALKAGFAAAYISAGDMIADEIIATDKLVGGAVSSTDSAWLSWSASGDRTETIKTVSVTTGPSPKSTPNSTHSIYLLVSCALRQNNSGGTFSLRVYDGSTLKWEIKADGSGGYRTEATHYVKTGVPANTTCTFKLEGYSYLSAGGDMQGIGVVAFALKR